MKKDIVSFIVIGSIYILGGVIIKKINDVQKEIEYLEDIKGINSRKEYYGKD